MEYVNLGNTGMRVSRICLGMMSFGNDSERAWVLDEDGAEPIVRAAVEGGVTFFDTADAYSGGASEVATGRLVGKMLTRDEAVIATKVFMPMTPGENGGGLSRKHVLSAIDASLSRLGMDYVDLYQIHRWDPRTPIEETMGALHDIVRAGKARYIGASSMFSWQFAKAQHVAERNGWTRFVSMQPHYNLLYREEEREMIPLCIDQGVGVIPWSPLARGVLTGNRTRDGEKKTTRSGTDPFSDYLYSHPSDFDVVDRVADVAAARGVPSAQVALAWLLHRPGVTAPIVGSTKQRHLPARRALHASSRTGSLLIGARLRSGPLPIARTGLCPAADCVRTSGVGLGSFEADPGVVSDQDAFVWSAHADHSQDPPQPEHHAATDGQVGELVIGVGGPQSRPEVVAHIEVVEREVLCEFCGQALTVTQGSTRPPVGDLAVEALVDPGCLAVSGPGVLADDAVVDEGDRPACGLPFAHRELAVGIDRLRQCAHARRHLRAQQRPVHVLAVAPLGK